MRPDVYHWLDSRLRCKLRAEASKDTRAVMLQGLYKVELETPRGKIVGVVFARDGKLRGGNSALAYIGQFQQTGCAVAGTMTARRHTRDPKCPSLFGVEDVRLTLHGFEKDGFATLDGTAAEAPSLGCRVVLARLCD